MSMAGTILTRSSRGLHVSSTATLAVIEQPFKGIRRFNKVAFHERIIMLEDGTKTILLGRV